MDLQALENTKSELESQVTRVCQSFNLVISTEKTLAEKVRMFQEKCTNLEEALSSANNVSSAEIRALKREIALSHEKNDNLNKAYEDLKKEHESILHARETEIEKAKRELSKKLKESDQKRIDLEAFVIVLNQENDNLKRDGEEKEQRINELMEFQIDSE